MQVNPSKVNTNKPSSSTSSPTTVKHSTTLPHSTQASHSSRGVITRQMSKRHPQLSLANSIDIPQGKRKFGQSNQTNAITERSKKNRL
ncbi:hypothetical protein BD408DRAFT_427046 [Parasitella parasitica]|nr:hypothetical protein BD408DRAFT_427046 [Parasitella parasitica]